MSRKCKTISFKLTDGYEMRLLDYAEKESNGDFSKYIKRLISRDMELHERMSSPPMNGIPSPATIEVMKPIEQDFSGFL